MINSRKIEDLHPKVQEMAKRLIARCASEGIELLVTCTYRDGEMQNALYARGRTVLTEGGHPVRKVTNAKAGQSFHNYRLALDVVPVRHGKPVWNTGGADAKLWARIGQIGKDCGFEWAGEWKTFREFPHFQWAAGLTLKQLQAGQRP